ncbi:MAG: FMN-binding protein [Calditrichaeota bacterium]|nr:MAG: FMN-binding protein [Calditrichota bacterium]
MKFSNFYILLLLFTLTGNVFSSIKNDAETSIKNIFGEESTLTFEKFKLQNELKNSIEKEAKQKFFRDEVYLWKITKNDSSLGFAILDNVLGKAMPITFLIIFDKEAKILSSEIIKYREAYGGQVGNRNWNEQFIGRNAESSFTVGKDVDGISGATISVNSVSKGIQKLCILAKAIKEKP